MEGDKVVRNRLTKELVAVRRASLLKLVEGGLSDEQIATSLDMHISSVRQDRVAAGIKRSRGKKGRSIDEIRQLRLDGLTRKQIAEKLNIHQSNPKLTTYSKSKFHSQIRAIEAVASLEHLPKEYWKDASALETEELLESIEQSKSVMNKICTIIRRM